MPDSPLAGPPYSVESLGSRPLTQAFHTVSGTGEPGSDLLVDVQGSAWGTLDPLTGTPEHVSAGEYRAPQAGGDRLVTVGEDGTWSVDLGEVPDGQYWIVVQDPEGRSPAVTSELRVWSSPEDRMEQNPDQSFLLAGPPQVTPAPSGRLENDTFTVDAPADSDLTQSFHTVSGTGEPGTDIVVDVSGGTEDDLPPRIAVVGDDGTWMINLGEMPDGESRIEISDGQGVRIETRTIRVWTSPGQRIEQQKAQGVYVAPEGPANYIAPDGSIFTEDEPPAHQGPPAPEPDADISSHGVTGPPRSRRRDVLVGGGLLTVAVTGGALLFWPDGADQVAIVDPVVQDDSDDASSVSDPGSLPGSDDDSWTFGTGSIPAGAISRWVGQLDRLYVALPPGATDRGYIAWPDGADDRVNCSTGDSLDNPGPGIQSVVGWFDENSAVVNVTHDKPVDEVRQSDSAATVVTLGSRDGHEIMGVSELHLGSPTDGVSSNGGAIMPFDMPVAIDGSTQQFRIPVDPFDPVTDVYVQTFNMVVDGDPITCDDAWAPVLNSPLPPTDVSGSCQSDAFTACVNNGRFAMQMTDANGLIERVEMPNVLFTDGFESGDTAAWASVHNECATTGNFSVSAVAATGVDITLMVDDTSDGGSSFSHPLTPDFPSFFDPAAFSCP